ncbi:VWA domain-containing protein [Candidatus Methylospira mobilis]|uniref:nitric oxide reductase activation protein NorD n=1 Tax=Candidatus Methylospira mobilis TaxID=1808979 RepID=UPI0028ED7D20|nr:VWA domain-containing protein [Candidatus Methylospira mobilis]WNV04947.1 VWA domain-containing protein [Candidatus Methylospira mobilis]
MTSADIPEALAAYWTQLDTGFADAKTGFAACMSSALACLTPDGVSAYLAAARFLGKMGRGAEPMLAFLQDWPGIARVVGEDALPDVMACAQTINRSPNGKAIAPFIASLAPIATSLRDRSGLAQYLALVGDFLQRTTGSIHGIHTTFASPGLPEFFRQTPLLYNELSQEGVSRWVDYGIRNYGTHPERQREYFNLLTPDSRAVFQRERPGTRFAEHERAFAGTLQALWRDECPIYAFSTLNNGEHDALAPLQPYYDGNGLHLPDLYRDRTGIGGMDRYRIALAHMAAHRRWSRAIIADNFSPAQRYAIETFEDARVDCLTIQTYPGLRPLLLALHPKPRENACDEKQQSAVRHRLALLSRALLDPNHGYRNADILDFAAQFRAALAQGVSGTRDMADLAIRFVAKTRRQSDQLPNVHFDDTHIDYRDDNRHLWIFIEEGDEETAFDHQPQPTQTAEAAGLPPRLYPEWDYASQSYRPDWVSVYESLQPAGNASYIDHLLEKHATLAKRLQRLLEQLKPQNKTRIRYQEDGSELDLDIALRALVDYRSGNTPDPRINMSHESDSRDIAVLLLLDLSASLNEKSAGHERSLLALSQEAVSLLGWATDRLGDALAIAGFQSNTRHEVHYRHIKGYSENWDDNVKSRLAGLEAGYSTRMGAAMRHAAHYLDNRKEDKKLMLILTDGEPADIDAHDPKMLIADAHKAVQELELRGIYSYCINLDARADNYVGDIFGSHYMVIDNVERLPERLPLLFMALTR